MRVPGRRAAGGVLLAVGLAAAAGYEVRDSRADVQVVQAMALSTQSVISRREGDLTFLVPTDVRWQGAGGA